MGSVGDITAALGPMELISIMAANAVIQEQARRGGVPRADASLTRAGGARPSR